MTADPNEIPAFVRKAWPRLPQKVKDTVYQESLAALNKKDSPPSRTESQKDP